MACGTLIIPDRPDWILLNPEQAGTATGAEVVEIRNGQRYGAPHFVHLDNGTPQKGEIERLMLEKWPGYRTVLEDTIVPAYDGEGRQINLDEWAQAPEPLFYRVTANLGMPFRNREGIQLILKEKEAPEGTSRHNGRPPAPSL